MRWFVLSALVAACAGHPSPPLLGAGRPSEPPLDVLVGPRPAEIDGPRATVVAAARRFLAGEPLTVRGLRFESDPVGFVRAVFWSVEVDLVDGRVNDSQLDGLARVYRSQALRERLHKETPRPGDLVFWDGDERQSALDPVQVAVVEEVSPQGRISAIGYFADGPARVQLSLRDHAPASDNTNLGGGSAAALFRSFADPWR